MRIKYILLAATSLLLFTNCNDTGNSTKVIKLEETPFTKEGNLSLFKASGSKIRNIDIEIADTDYEREMGLMNRNQLATHQGMLFVMNTQEIQTFHMKNTRIPLDLVYLNKEKQIVSFSENAKPMDEKILSSIVPAAYVLELNAGMAQEWVLEIGDYATW